MHMGRGIAVEFRQRFGRVQQLRAQHAPIGGVAFVRVPQQPPPQAHAQAQAVVGAGAVAGPSRTVYYLVTKAVYRDKPTYAALARSLAAMRTHLYAEAGAGSGGAGAAGGDMRVSLPRIGCGLDGLQWPHVLALLRALFARPPAPLRLSLYSL